MNEYLNWVRSAPLLSAALQFAVLGTLGEVVSHGIKTKRLQLPCSWWQLGCKVAAWAVLGIIIKYGFTGMKGFAAELIEHNLLPLFLSTGIGWAFIVSVLTNLFFGPQMMFFHRLEDNLIAWKWNLDGLVWAWWTLLWFWIPAHTVTFSLPPDYQIALAALWSLVLGIILGLANRGGPPKRES